MVFLATALSKTINPSPPSSTIRLAKPFKCYLFNPKVAIVAAWFPPEGTLLIYLTEPNCKLDDCIVRNFTTVCDEWKFN